MDYQTDIVIVGAGVVGSAIARELSKYQLDVMLVEERTDVGGIASKCNGATIGKCSISSELMFGKIPEDISKVVRGAALLYPRVLSELNVKHKQVGCLVVAFSQEEMDNMDICHRKAMEAGDYSTYRISREELLAMEPMVNPEAVGAYYCPDDIIVDVFDLVVAQVENAMHNGVRLLTGAKATAVDIDPETNAVKGLHTSKGYIKAKYVINAAAIYAEELAKTTGHCNFRNYPRYGQFFVLDKNLPYAPSHLVRPCPNEVTTGRLLTLTVSGNLMVGPSADNGEVKDFSATTKEIMDSILADCKKLIPAINPRDSVTQFGGIRPAKDPADWVIEVSKNVKGYCEAIGISQGVTAGPGVAAKMCYELEMDGLELIRKADFDPIRKPIKRFVEMTQAEKDAAIKEDPRYGNVICRCETVTEAEIVRAIHTEPKATSVDAIKRRLRAGMGRCQGGFCSPRVVEILAREMNVPVETITKNEVGSEIVVRHNRK